MDDEPAAIELGLAVILTVGAALPVTVILTAAVVVPPMPAAVAV
jgi:hypothetical protein